MTTTPNFDDLTPPDEQLEEWSPPSQRKSAAAPVPTNRDALALIRRALEQAGEGVK